MKVIYVICVATLATFLGSFVPMTTAQVVNPAVNLRALCAIWAFVGFIIERVRCDREIEEQRDDFLSTVCRKRFGGSAANCQRCLEIGEDRDRCDADLGANGSDDTPGNAANDDCEYDTNFDVCLDEVEPPT